MIIVGRLAAVLALTLVLVLVLGAKLGRSAGAAGARTGAGIGARVDAFVSESEADLVLGLGASRADLGAVAGSRAPRNPYVTVRAAVLDGQGAPVRAQGSNGDDHFKFNLDGTVTATSAEDGLGGAEDGPGGAEDGAERPLHTGDSQDAGAGTGPARTILVRLGETPTVLCGVVNDADVAVVLTGLRVAALPLYFNPDKIPYAVPQRAMRYTVEPGQELSFEHRLHLPEDRRGIVAQVAITLLFSDSAADYQDTFFNETLALGAADGTGASDGEGEGGRGGRVVELSGDGADGSPSWLSSWALPLAGAAAVAVKVCSGSAVPVASSSAGRATGATARSGAAARATGATARSGAAARSRAAASAPSH